MRSSLVFVCALLATTASAAEVRQLGPHVHGQANLQVALEGRELAVELASPGIGLLDFEHPPGDMAESGRLGAVMAALRNPQWLRFPVAAQCRLRDADVGAVGYDRAGKDTDGPGQHHHAGFHARYGFACTHPERLDHVQVLLMQRFPGLHRVIVDIATPAGQDREEVDAADPRVSLSS